MRVDSKATPVLVLKMEHYGSLGIMRSLGRMGVPVYALDASPRAIASYSRYCRGRYVWDIENAPPEESIDYLSRIAKAIGGQPVLIPTSDETTEFVAHNAARLRPRFRFHDIRPDLVTALANKKELYRLALQYNVPTPKTIFPASKSDLVASLDSIAYPIIVKGIDVPSLSARAGTRMVIVHDRGELLEAYDRLEEPGAPNLVIQEYIEGADDSAWLYNGVFNDNSECLVEFTGKKIRLNPVYTGMTSFGKCEWNEQVARSANQFLRDVGYRGVVDIDYRYDERDGEYKILDVNPRIGASFRMFVTGEGLDVARALYFDLIGEKVVPSRPEDGRLWLVEDKDLLSSYRYLRDGKLRSMQWLESVRGVDETAYFAKDDKAPFWRMWESHLRRSFDRFRHHGGNTHS